MANNKRKRPQAVKVKSPGAKALTLSRRGGEGDRVPSGTVYSRRPKHASRGWE